MSQITDIHVQPSAGSTSERRAGGRLPHGPALVPRPEVV